jgi:hypothetical protein
MKRALVLLLALPTLALPQDLLPPGVLLLSRAKRHVGEELARLPNISCLETVQRERQAANGKPRPLDTVRLEVLTNGKKELYAAPGERKFSEEHPIQYVGSGVIGDGFFGLFLKEVFLDGGASYEYKGEEDLGGRRAARYNWRIPLMNSGHSFALQEGSGMVGMRGSFWVNPETYDVIRLEMNAEDFPPTLPLSEAVTVINYGRVSIGDEQFVLLPESGDFRMTRFSGESDHNHIEFTHCRLYGAQSTISFAAPDAPPSTEPARFGISGNDDTLRPLPAGLQIGVKLNTRITAEATVGTLIEGVVTSAMPAKGAGKGARSPILANARVRGRIRRLERYSTPVQHYVVAVEFTEAESEGIRYRFYAELQELDAASGATAELNIEHRTDGAVTRGETLWLPKLPGVAAFFVRGAKLELAPGFRTTWKTLALKP